MEPVEVNAGAWYLRALRCDDRLSDVPALLDLGVEQPEAYCAEADAGWEREDRCVWAVCIPTTGELIALIGVAPDSFTGIARAGYDEALDAAVGPVSRFAEAALDMVPAAFRSPAVP